ncbi:hypothetical protein B0H13DRAFT_1870877 [Mycena leptocephala]|nr:hypothetical protein B0H13DRAFT_1870877 [Mycena leptocephala]
MSEFTSQRRLGLKASLRTACKFLPMPLCLGWDTDPTGDDSSPDAKVTGLLLSDIASGATRVVEGAWMHALYKHTSIAYPPGTIVMNLREAGYTSKIGLPHIAMISTLIIQIFVVLVFMAHGSTRREARYFWPAASCGFLNIFRFRDVCQFGRRGCTLAIAAKKSVGSLVPGSNPNLGLASARGVYGNHFEQFPHPSVLLAGTAASELVAAWGNVLPTRHSVVLDTENPMLDRVVAACQFANSVSIGFVENILPIPTGRTKIIGGFRPCWGQVCLDRSERIHGDAETAGPDLEEHPHHQQATTVLQSTLKRRREHQGDSSLLEFNGKSLVAAGVGPKNKFYHPGLPGPIVRVSIFRWWLAQQKSRTKHPSKTMLRNEEDGAWYSPEDAEGIR